MGEGRSIVGVALLPPPVKTYSDGENQKRCHRGERLDQLAIASIADGQHVPRGSLRLPRHAAFATIGTRLLEVYHEHHIAVTQELTLADVLQQLGGISPRRIRFRPAPGTATEEDVIKIRDRERRLFELVDGVLVEKVMGFWESVLAIELARLLGNFVKRRKLGTLAGEAGMLRLSPGLVRIPDLSFISRGSTLAHHRRRCSPLRFFHSRPILPLKC